MKILHGDDRIERHRKSGGGKRPGDRIDVGISLVDGFLIGAVLRLEGDELGRLEAIDVAVRPDRSGEDAGEIAPAHHEIADLFALVDLGEGQQLGGHPRRIARPFGGGAGRIGQRCGISLGGGLGRDRNGTRGKQGGAQRDGADRHIRFSQRRALIRL